MAGAGRSYQSHEIATFRTALTSTLHGVVLGWVMILFESRMRLLSFRSTPRVWIYVTWKGFFSMFFNFLVKREHKKALENPSNRFSEGNLRENPRKPSVFLKKTQETLGNPLVFLKRTNKSKGTLEFLKEKHGNSQFSQENQRKKVQNPMNSADFNEVMCGLYLASPLCWSISRRWSRVAGLRMFLLTRYVFLFIWMLGFQKKS